VAIKPSVEYMMASLDGVSECGTLAVEIKCSKSILEKANDGIKAVAKANGYTYIFDSGAGSILFADESDDVLPLLKAYLKLPEPKPAPAATTPK
jgi:outer membrane protein